MGSLRVAVAKITDVRQGEWRVALLSFVVLALVSGAHTMLETARDALLVVWLPKREFGVAYVAVAAAALFATGLVTRLSHMWAPRNVLAGTLVVAATIALVFTRIPPTRYSVIALYVVVGLTATIVFPQFWLMMGGLLTVGQSRRLLGSISAAGILGGALGASVAAGITSMMSVSTLLITVACTFAAAAAFVLLVPREGLFPAPPKENTKIGTAASAMKEEPFLYRVAALVVLAAATALVIDYYFKWTIARSVAAEERGAYIARYYAIVNVATLTVQLFVGSAIVRRLGVASAIVLTPFFLLLGSGGALIAGAAVLPVLLLRGADGTLRTSIHRLTTELVYLPVSAAGRERAKPFIDGALMRIAQAVTAGAILALGNVHLLSPRVFAFVIVLLALAWFAVAISLRAPYIGQLEQAVTPSARLIRRKPEPIDVASAELLVESLGSDDPAIVLAAMNMLSRRGRQRLLPALILRHDDPGILGRALEIFGESSRTDWISLALRLVDHPSERVRVAAARALAQHGRLDPQRLSIDVDPTVRGYATVHAALADGPNDLRDDPRIADLMSIEAARIGMLAAIADAPQSARASQLLIEIAELEWGNDAEWIDLLARASARHHELRMIPRLVRHLRHREGRESIRVALVLLGEPALEEVARALDDPDGDRNLRVHLPTTLARFGTKWAANKVLDCIERDRDGLVRYQAVRALGRLVADHAIVIERARIERCVRANLATHLQLLCIRAALGDAPAAGQRAATTYRLFTGMLDDKLRQSLERAFRLLKIAFPKDDIHRMYSAAQHDDKRERANAGEFLDALLARRDQQSLRDLFRVILDDISPQLRRERAHELLGTESPKTPEEAVRAALSDADVKLATLAALFAVASGEESLIASVKSAREKRPDLADVARQLFQGVLPLEKSPAHA